MGAARRCVGATSHSLHTAALVCPSKRAMCSCHFGQGLQSRHSVRSTVRVASRLAGTAVIAAEFFQNEQLLGRSVIDDTAMEGEARLSKWTLAQRRSAVRTFVTLMRPELGQLLGEDPNIVLDRSLRAVAERVGGDYRL